MVINITRSEDEILREFSEDVQKKIRSREKKITVKHYECSREEHEEMFVLLYAFYKDDAYMRRLTIPTYQEVFKEFNHTKKHATLLFAFLDNAPIAALWVQEHEELLQLRYSGSILFGYEVGADAVLLWEAIRLGKKNKLRQIEFDQQKLFHGMMI